MIRRDEKCIQKFGRKIPRYRLGDVGVDVRVILKWILRKEDVRV
jgi:hypothetical protein